MVKKFTVSGGIVLLVTGAGKVFGATGTSQILQVPDPIFGLAFRQLMFLVGVAEILIGCFCLISKNTHRSTRLIAWISSGFLVYRLGLWFLNWQQPCSCLGALTEALHIAPQTANSIMKFALAYLLGGSFFLLLLERTKAVSGPDTPGISIQKAT